MQRISITNPQNIIDGTAKKYYFKLRNTGGPKGDKGDKGDTGATGPQGPQGNAATVSVGSTTTLPVGYDATVTNAGSIYNAVLDFGIPQGPQGPQGAKGDKGDTGAKGDTGPRGPQGERGTNATVYIGTTSTLNPGSQATVYNSGTDNNAVLNFGIPKGEKGDTGATGATGATGPAGQDGQSFTPTIVAELPATGDESKLYLTPKSHTTSTATGNPITASVTEQAGKIESFQLDGDTAQQTWTGKNILPLKNLSQGGIDTTYNYLTGELSCSGKATQNWPRLVEKTDLTIANGATITVSTQETHSYDLAFRFYYSSTEYENVGIVSGSTNSIKTLSHDITAVEVLYNTGTNTTISDTFKAMLEIGGSATTFEPYVGGVPSPNPDYPQPIQTVTGLQTITVASLNLFDGVFEIGNISTTTGTDINADTMIRSKNYAVIEGGESYTISVVGGGNVALRFYQSDETFIGTGTTGPSPNTFTAPANAGKVRFIVTSNTNLSTKAQCEKGSSATDWTPYFVPSSYPLDLGAIELCKLGDYQDYIYKDGDDWKVYKELEEHIFDGSETFTSDGSYEGIYQYRWTDSSVLNTADQDLVGVKSDKFMGIGYKGSWLIDFSIALRYNNNALRFMTSLSSTVEAFKAWLASNNTTVYYALATSTDITITDTMLIAQLEAIRTASLENGTNTITNTAASSNLAGDMEIGYYGYNPRNRYDKWLWLDINNEYEQIGE